jgi:hypothetical protein
MWTLDEALPLIRKISPIAREHGFSVALYGSVLDRGRSERDLDLFFIEQDPDICDVQGCLDEISKLPEVHHCGQALQCVGGALCPIWLQDRKHHIDAQFRLLKNGKDDSST